MYLKMLELQYTDKIHLFGVATDETITKYDLECTDKIHLFGVATDETITKYDLECSSVTP